MFYDINNKEINIGDVIKYDDVEHSMFNKTGFVRKNLLNEWEVVSEDLQSGNNLENITNIEVWQ